MTWTCPECGASNPVGTRFCGYCGIPARRVSSPPIVREAAPASAPGDASTPHQPAAGGESEDERRLVTAVFADLSGFTALADRVDADELHEIIGPLISELAAVAERFGGYVAKYAGDALLVTFGAPVALEDHAARALMVALRMHAALDDALPKLSPAASGLKLHVGVNSGRVVAGMFGGEVRDYSILGDAVNLAQRLESVAPPGETYVGELTYALAQGRFDLAPLRELTLKGKQHTVRAWRLLGESADHAEEAAARPGVRSLVGRERELATASHLVKGLSEGRGALLLVTGDAGIGKSRLIEEVRRRASGVRWLDGHCVSYGASLPYWPFVDLLRRALGIQPEDGAAEAERRLAAALSDVGLLEALPYFGHLLGVLSASPSQEEGDVAPEAIRRGLHEMFTTWIRTLARQRPVIVAIEDLHWADPSTIELTQEFGRLAEEVPVGLLLTGRPEAEPTLALVAGASEGVPSARMTLRPLDESAISALVEQVLGGGTSPELLAPVLQRTAGNPFFAEEMVRSLVDAGTLRRNGRWHLDPGWDAGSVPPTVDGVLSARIDLLPPVAAKVLQIASVIGTVIRRPLLHAVATDVAELEEAVRRLLESGFLRPLSLDDEEALVFHHPLTLEVAYSRLLRRRRKELHRRVAEATEDLYGAGDNVIDFLARHLYLAEAGEKAVEYLLRAAERSKRLFANEEAVFHLTRGLEVLERLPDTAERAQQELRVQTALASPLIAVRGHGALEVERLCERARELGQQVPGTAELFPVLFGLVGFHTARGNLAKASEFGEQLMAVAEGARDDALVVVASFAQGATLFYRGQLAAARNHLERGISIYGPEEHASLALRYAFDPGVGCLRVLALVLWLLGYPDQALARSNEAVALARHAAQPYGLAGAMVFSAVLHHCRREAMLARQQAEATAVRASEHGFPLWLAWAQIVRGWALVEEASRRDSKGSEEHLAELLAELKENLAAYEGSGSQIFRPYWMALAAEADRRAGRLEGALSLVSCALQVAEENEERWWEAELWRMRGELLLELSLHPAEAEANLRQALATAAQQGARALELRAALSLSRLRQAEGNGPEARQIVAPVYSGFVEGFDSEDLKDARAVLEAQSGDSHTD